MQTPGLSLKFPPEGADLLVTVTDMHPGHSPFNQFFIQHSAIDPDHRHSPAIGIAVFFFQTDLLSRHQTAADSLRLGGKILPPLRRINPPQANLEMPAALSTLSESPSITCTTLTVSLLPAA